jgi:beta-glucosidase
VNSGEGRDRESLKLAEEDVALILETAKACKQAGTPCIVLLNVCGVVEMAEWIDEVDAVLLIWLGGMELGHAAAALLVGDENPSGKLPLTAPVRYQDTPAYLNFPGEYGEVRYGEGIYVGYRYYDAKDVRPQFPFGYGLSYTRFELSNLRLSAETIDVDAGETLTVSVDVTNRGARAGQEVVQLYIADVEATPHRPAKELKGFAKVSVAPGETQTVELTVDKRSLQHYHPLKATWCVEPGVFEVLVGVSAAEIRLSAEFRATGWNPYGYGPETSIGKVMADPRAVAVLQRRLPPEIASREAFQMELTYGPERPIGAVLSARIERGMGHLSAEERASVERALFEELAAIEV